MPHQAPFRAETPLLHTLIDTAPTFGWLAYHALPATMSSGRFITPYLGDKGFPDLVLVHPVGGILFRELKGEGHYPTPAQRLWLTRIEQAAKVGVTTGVWRPRDLQDAVEQLGGKGTWRP